ncbi:hypothetical protein PRZ48_002383 [Zasmidium cellare]|uniref:HIG1 domain-containing protein n=1 Tax=Zasmidium cellare TaxID=395010 RepID=A0ABR0F3W4_ZASCE|nr:hypothetical protein PRZ48_002383 [Zasmidium cellare]
MCSNVLPYLKINETKQSPLFQAYKYHVIFTIYATATGLAFWRIRRQPYNASMKTEQYETIFKGTILAAAIAAIAAGKSEKR